MYATLLELGMSLTSEGLAVARDIDRSFNASAMEVAFVLAPPWFYGGVATTVRGEEQPFTVTRQTLDRLHTEGVSHLLSRQDFVSWEDVMGSHELMEHLNQALLLEGYPVQTWEGRTVHEFALTGYYAIASSNVLEQVRTILERVLPHHHPLAYTSTRLLADLYHSALWGGATAQAIFIEVSGQVTTVVTMRKGIMRHVRTVPVGTDIVLRTVAPKAISAKEAESKLELLMGTVGGAGTQGDGHRVSAEARGALEEWYNAVQEEILAQSDGVTPPELVLLMADSRWHSALIPLLSQPYLAPGVREERSFTVQPCSTFVSASHEGDDIPPEAIRDVRLQVFTHAIGVGLRD